MKTLISFIIFLLMILFPGVGNAQPFTMNLWPGGIPGSIADETYAEKITTEDGRVIRCEKVKNPDLTVFLPSPEKANGTAVLIYPVISFDTTITHRGTRNNLIGLNPVEAQVRRFSNDLQITAETPPAFLVHSADDKVVPVMNSINYFRGLQKMNIPAELHIFQKGGHGYGLATDRGTESSWPELCLKWMKAMGLL